MAGVGAGVTLILTPVFRWVALRTGVLSYPTYRGVHDKPIPYLGGLAMLGGVVAAIYTATRLETLRGGVTATRDLWAVMAGAVIITLVGALDDWRDVSAPAKLAGQILAGSVMGLLGVVMIYFRVPFGDFVALGRDLAPLVTILWVIGMCNAINAIDGLDGLAAGVVGIASIAFFIFSLGSLRQGFLDETTVGPLLAAVTAGTCLGFLPWNWHPSKIIMGDAGAYLLGIMMAASTIVVGGTPDVYPGQTYFVFSPLLVPLIILGVAIFDAGFAVFRRLVTRRSWHLADREHLHHRLLRLGHGHRRAVLILWAWTALLSAVVLVPTFLGRSNAALPLLVGGVAIGLFTFLAPTGKGSTRMEHPTRRARRASRKAVRESA